LRIPSDSVSAGGPCPPVIEKMFTKSDRSVIDQNDVSLQITGPQPDFTAAPVTIAEIIKIINSLLCALNGLCDELQFFDGTINDTSTAQRPQRGF
jgi:hypothetical protein